MNESSRARRSAPSLLPLFRSQAQYALVGELYTNPELELTVGELAARVGASHPTISREVDRLSTAGLLRTRAQGNRTLVSANTNTPIFADLRNVMSKVYGVIPVLEDEFAGLAERLVLFGSWAARWSGEPGPQPQDVDVLVIGDADADAVWDAAARASQRLGMEVNVTLRTVVEWQADDSGFAAGVRTRPHLELAVSEPLDAPVVTSTDEERRWG